MAEGNRQTIDVWALPFSLPTLLFDVVPYAYKKSTAPPGNLFAKLTYRDDGGYLYGWWCGSTLVYQEWGG